MKILGIDQSFTNCAWIVFEGDAVLDYNVIKSNKDDDKFARALYVATELVKVYNIHKPDHTSLEGLAFGSRGNVTRDLSGLLFTIVNLIVYVDINCAYNIVTPTSVKKFATGNGKAKKNDMIDALPQKLKDKFVDKGFKKTTGLADLADAYFIGRYSESLLEKK